MDAGLTNKQKAEIRKTKEENKADVEYWRLQPYSARQQKKLGQCLWLRDRLNDEYPEL